MVNFEIIILSLVTVTILLLLGYIVRSKGDFFKMAGFTILLITSITLLISPPQFPSGDTISGGFTYASINNQTILNTSNYSVVTDYSEQNTFISRVFSFTLLLGSLWGIIDTVSEFKKIRDHKLEDPDDDSSEKELR